MFIIGTSPLSHLVRCCLFDILLKEYISLDKLHKQIAHGYWNFEDEAGNRILASLRIELLESVFLCLFIWEHKTSIDLECTEGMDVNSLFYVKFKKKTEIQAVKGVAADLIIQLITNGQIETSAGTKDYTIISVQ